MRGMRARAAVVGLVLLALLLPACAQLPVGSVAAPAPRSLHLLLTNDDGVCAPGITALHEALLASGHRVTVVAPSRNRSGSSVSLTTGGTLSVKELEPGVYSVDGTPADCVLLALRRIIEDPVDMVVSGVNFGQNLGVRLVSSGTVGAAIAAAGEGIPAIAASQTVDPEDYRKTPRFFPDSAAFTVSLVDRLSTRTAGPLLPPGVVLNVNYPALPREAVAGVMLTHQGASILYELDYAPEGDGRYDVSFTPAEEIDTRPNADTRAIANGYVSVTPLYASWTSQDQVMSELRPLADGLEPLPASGAP
jgi:5'-nucleotidase